MSRLKHIIDSPTYEALEERWEAFRKLLRKEKLFFNKWDEYFEDNWMSREWKRKSLFST